MHISNYRLTLNQFQTFLVSFVLFAESNFDKDIFHFKPMYPVTRPSVKQFIIIDVITFILTYLHNGHTDFRDNITVQSCNL